MLIKRSFADLQAKTSEIVDLCFQSDEPIHISCEGDREIVLISGKEYEQYEALMVHLGDLALSEWQFLNGEAYDFKKVIGQIRRGFCD